MNEKEIIANDQALDLISSKYVQNGNDNIAIDNKGSVNFNINIQLPCNSRLASKLQIPIGIDTEYYNLFVCQNEKFKEPYFYLPRDRALDAYTNENTRKLFDALTPEIIERIKTMPSLFMAENHQYGKADPDQYVMYGFVTDISFYEDNISLGNDQLKIGYSVYNIDIPQQTINEMTKELDLPSTKNHCCYELNHTHWAIKHRNLIKELTDAGIQIPIPNYQDKYIEDNDEID